MNEFDRTCVACDELVLPGEDFAVLKGGAVKCMGCYNGN